jgi:hypothetical protein
MALRHGRIEPLRQFGRRHEKLKHPGFDHSALPHARVSEDDRREK